MLDPSSTAPRRRATGMAWTSLVLSVVLVVASIWLADSRQVLRQLRTVDPRWIGVAFLISLAQLAVLGLRWSFIASQLGLRLGWLRATTEYALSILGNQVLPSGVAGDGVRALRQSRAAGSGQLLRVVEALALDRVSGQMALWLVVLSGTPLSVRAGVVHVGPLFLGVSALAATGMGVWFLLSRLSRFDQQLNRVRRLLRRSASVLLSGKSALVHLPLSLLMVGFTVLQLYVAAYALDVVLPWQQLWWLGPLILVAASMPSFFGGWGIREGASALLFAAAGMPKSTGVAVSMVYGAFALVSSIPGLMVLFLDTRPVADVTPKA